MANLKNAVEQFRKRNANKKQVVSIIGSIDNSREIIRICLESHKGKIPEMPKEFLGYPVIIEVKKN